MLTEPQQRVALDVAVTAIRSVLSGRGRWLPDVTALPEGLRLVGASFVTLRRHGELRGCIGSLVARQPLGIDIARHAVDAAFDDPRFPPLANRELSDLHCDISVLTPLEPLDIDGLDALRQVVRPGTDGLLVECGHRRGTLLPAVWESLPQPDAFLQALWRKAGLHPGEWPHDLTVCRYTAEEFGGEAADHLTTA